MKKFLLFFALTMSVASGIIAQPTFVSTEPSNRNVILEEFTGKGCVYCPDGHRVANQIAAANPERFWTINIHQGSYASGTPDYKTEFGDAIAGQSGLTGYPAGTVNRGSALGRGAWSGAVTTQLGQASPVNVAAQTTVDYITRKMTVSVEVYYTANGTPATNKLNVALLQNEIIGPQTGMNYNPDYIVDGQYRHMHMLRHLLTGQWGVEIPNTTEGSFFTQTFEYDIPENYRNIPVLLEDLEVVAFVAQGNKTIETGCKSTYKLLNYPEINPKIISVNPVPNNTCDCMTDLDVVINNIGSEDITSIYFIYDFEGDDIIWDFAWSGDPIPWKATDTVRIKDVRLPKLGENVTMNLIIDKVNGQDFTSEYIKVSLSKDVREVRNSAEFILVTDKYGSDNTFRFTSPDGSTLLEGGPWDNLTSTGTTERKFDFIPTMIGCHQLEVNDANGDGINTNYGKGYFKLVQYDGKVVIDNDGKFGKRAHYLINVPTIVGIENIESDDILVYPNPAKDQIHINGEYLSASIVDINGKIIKTIYNESSVNISSLKDGVYMLLINDGVNIRNKKIVVSR